MVGETVVVNGATRKFVKLNYGFKGDIPDGLISRVSSIYSQAATAWAMQQRFVTAILLSLSASTRTHLTGS